MMQTPQTFIAVLEEGSICLLRIYLLVQEMEEGEKKSFLHIVFTN